MDRVIHLSQELPCSPSRAFDYFSMPELLTAWLCTEAEVSPAVGGKYELFWDPSNKQDNSTVGCKVTALSNQQFISFEWKSPVMFKSFANHADPLTHVMVSFHQVEKGTAIHLVHTGWRSSDNWLEAADWQENAWSIAFNNLAALVKEE